MSASDLDVRVRIKAAAGKIVQAAGRRDQISGECEQQAAAIWLAVRLCVLGERLSASEYDDQPPDEHGGRGDLDDTVGAEGDQRHAARPGPPGRLGEAGGEG